MPIVLDCVVLEDNVDGARRHTKRRCTLKCEAPYLFKKIIGIEVAFFIQENYLDLSERKLIIEATNETFSSRIKIFEKCRYYVHPENPDWTCFDQSANIEITNFLGFEHQMEKIGMKQYTQMTLKGKEIIEFFIDELKEEGITHVDIWKDPEGSIVDSKSYENECDAKELKRLNADYIKKYLGELTPMQESRLLQMRAKLEDQNLEQVTCDLLSRKLARLTRCAIFFRSPTIRHFCGFSEHVTSALRRHQPCSLSR
jgi:PRELI-like family